MGMKILENIPLAPLTTLHIGGPARYFAEATNELELLRALDFARVETLPIFILGGGSNVLVSDKGFDGLVIRPIFLGRELLTSDVQGSPTSDVGVRVRIGAGENLDEVIAWTVERGWWGLENLSFIPGLVGALAIQNVGAYGQEAAHVIESVHVFDTERRTSKVLDNNECRFEYRHSIFNTNQRGRYVILRIILKLRNNRTANLSYKDLQNYFADKVPTQKEIRQAVIEIRTKKGQDPNEVWSAGSFFKNFVVSDNEGNEYKISAGDILDKRLGLKGLQVGGAKLSEKQVLNLINTGNATAEDCLGLFHKVRNIVKEKTSLELIPEPEFVGF